MATDNSVIAPEWFDDRDINFSEIIQVTEVANDTVRGWHALLQASDTEFGVKFRNNWHFSTRELCAFSLAAALRQLGYPVGLTVLKDIVAFVRTNHTPERPFTIGFHGLPAVVLVDAETIYGAVIEMMANVREANA